MSLNFALAQKENMMTPPRGRLAGVKHGWKYTGSTIFTVCIVYTAIVCWHFHTHYTGKNIWEPRGDRVIVESALYRTVFNNGVAVYRYILLLRVNTQFHKNLICFSVNVRQLQQFLFNPGYVQYKVTVSTGQSLYDFSIKFIDCYYHI